MREEGVVVRCCADASSFADAVRSDQVSHGVLPLLGTGFATSAPP